MCGGLMARGGVRGPGRGEGWLGVVRSGEE